MKKHKLKSYLTLEQAAEYLTSILDEPFCTADILQFALEGHLTLSVNFVNHAKARPGKIVRYTRQEVGAFITMQNCIDDLNWVEDLGAILDAKAAGQPVPNPVPKIMCSRPLGIDRWMTFDEAVTTLTGIWDLAMVGGERLDAEFEFQALTDGPSVTLVSLDGSFVTRNGDVACQLMELHDSVNEEGKGRTRTFDDYYPAGGLPNDSVLVVRTEALKELEARLVDAPAQAPSEDLKTRNKRSFQTVIAGFCFERRLDWNARGTAKIIEGLTEKLGAKVDEDTIKNVILKGMDDAVESRIK